MRFVHNVWIIDRNDKLWWLTQTDTQEQAEERLAAFVKYTDRSQYRMTLIGMCSYENRAWVFEEPEWNITYYDGI